MSTPAELVVPSTVAVEMAEELREGLLALAVGTGLQVMTALMEEEVTRRPLVVRRGRRVGRSQAASTGKPSAFVAETNR